MSMRENLCRANLLPEAMRENPLSCKYIAGNHFALAKRLVNRVVVVAIILDSCGKDNWFKSFSQQHRLS
jgi:hypothetical protein